MDIRPARSSIAVGIGRGRAGPDSRAMTPRTPTHQATDPDPSRRPVAPPDPSGPDDASPLATQRILVVDGDHRVRDSLADLIGLADGVVIVGTTSQLEETLEAIARLVPDVVVIDPYLPDVETGLALIRTLRTAGRRVLRIVATCRDDDLGPVALAAGADACVDRCADPSVFQEAVLAAARLDDEPAGQDVAGHMAHVRFATHLDRSGGTL
jgi:CheY-like chemotaxis protein